MIRDWLLMLALGAAGAGSAGAVPTGDLAPLQPGLDYHSFANTDQFRVIRAELDMRVDTSQKVLRGVVGLQLKRLDPGATEVILDTRDLNVADVNVKAQDVLGATSKSETTWVSRPYHFEKKDPILGQALVIEVPPSRRSSEFVRIEYETSPSAPALQWLSAAQTKHKAFLYTLSEPLGARSWIPLQDTPQVRFTFKAVIHTDPDLVAVMGARSDALVKRGGEYSFTMQDAIPSYLLALAVGDLKYQATGPRTGVYAPKAQLKAAAQEFADADAMLGIGEKILGPYRFERYDIAVMPRSFPVGGTGSPRLALVSPTIIAGDKSLVGVLAHQVAHAWCGDLVNNATWRDLWLNEGFSDYVAGRIMSDLYGAPRQAMSDFDSLRGLRSELTRLKPADSALAVDLRNRDPQEGFTAVPYVKGRLFLEFLESRFGRDRFDAFLRAYVDHFAFRSLTSDEFVQYLDQNLIDRFPGIVTHREVGVWLADGGIPAPAASADVFASVERVRAEWLRGATPAHKLAVRDWVPEQWMYFLDDMPSPLTPAQLSDLDQAYGFGRSPNDEIARRWLTLVARNRYQPAFVRLEEYLSGTGRLRLIVPLYEELMRTPAGAAQARRVFKIARSGYHPLAVAAVDPIVNPADAAEPADE